MDQVLKDECILLNPRDRFVQQVLQRQRLLIRRVENDVGDDFLELWVVAAALLDRVDCTSIVVQKSSIEQKVVGEALKEIAHLNIFDLVPLLLLQLGEKLAMHSIKIFNLEEHCLEVFFRNHRLRRCQRSSDRFHVLRHFIQAINVERLACDDAGDDLVDDGASRSTRNPSVGRRRLVRGVIGYRS